jgi:hypothetical protein
VTYACLVISRPTGLGHRHHFQQWNKPHSPDSYETKTPLSRSGRKKSPLTISGLKKNNKPVKG